MSALEEHPTLTAWLTAGPGCTAGKQGVKDSDWKSRRRTGDRGSWDREQAYGDRSQREEGTSVSGKLQPAQMDSSGWECRQTRLEGPKDTRQVTRGLRTLTSDELSTPVMGHGEIKPAQSRKLPLRWLRGVSERKTRALRALSLPVSARFLPHACAPVLMPPSMWCHLKAATKAEQMSAKLLYFWNGDLENPLWVRSYPGSSVL